MRTLLASISVQCNLINQTRPQGLLAFQYGGGEKTLGHSRNHVNDSSTESGNLFKMAGKHKGARIWVRDLETGGKQSKWRQRRTQCAHGKKLKITMNTRTSASHRNTVEGYLDTAILFCSSMTFFILNFKVLTCAALDNLT